MIALLTFSKHTSKSSAFTSTITGFAPQCTITFAVAQYVYAGTITSSPSCTPNHRSTTSSPTVFEFTANVALFPQYAVNLRSNSFVFGPVVIQPDFKVSTTSSMTFWSILGGENGIIIKLLNPKHSIMYPTSSLLHLHYHKADFQNPLYS